LKNAIECALRRLDVLLVATDHFLNQISWFSFATIVTWRS